MEKIRKANRHHICDTCNRPILRGTKYVFEFGRRPILAQDDEYSPITQEGIEYYTYKHHLPEEHCSWPEECKKGNHVITSNYDADPESDTCGKTYTYCEECGENFKCEECGEGGEELYPCDKCEKLMCHKCQASYNQFTQIDHNCCKSCAENREEH